MKHTALTLTAAAILSLMANTAIAAEPAGTATRPAAAETCYLFSYFIDNGEDGLHLAHSSNGYKWETLGGGKPFLVPKVGKAKLMRDPFLLRARRRLPDGVVRQLEQPDHRTRFLQGPASLVGAAGHRRDDPRAAGDELLGAGSGL